MKRKLLWIVGIIATLAIATIIFCNGQVTRAASGKLYDDTSGIPYRKTGLLLGTSKYLGDGRENVYYTYRIAAALKLLREGKIKYLIISGDNSTRDYDEPTQMKSDLVALGIDSSRIFLDYAGFRTFDSIIRAREIFGQDSLVIISQPFHNERALFIASREHIDAIGFNAKDISGAYGLKVQLREKLARVKVYLDFLFHIKPKFLGEKISMPQ